MFVEHPPNPCLACSNNVDRPDTNPLGFAVRPSCFQGRALNQVDLKGCNPALEARFSKPDFRIRSVRSFDPEKKSPPSFNHAVGGLDSPYGAIPTRPTVLKNRTLVRKRSINRPVAIENR